MVRLARGAGRGNRGKMGRGRGLGPPPPLMARNNVMPPPIPPPRMPPPRMRPLPPPGMRSPPFAPPIPPLPPPPHRLRPPPPRLPPVPPIPPLRRNLPFPPRPPGPMFPPHGPIPRMPPPPIPPPLMRGRGRLLPRGMELRHTMKIRKLGVIPFKPRRGRRNKPVKDKSEGDFFCVTCDRGFKTEEKLQQHFSEHIVCGIDGCTLTAHQKIIEKHILLLHETGLYSKVGKKDSPEDIAQWIAERKRNYPTKKNMEEKVAQRAEMEQRGERIHEDKRRFAKKPVGKDRNNRNQKNNQFDNNKSKIMIQSNSSGKRFRQRSSKLKPVLDTETEQQDSWRGSLPHFPGIDLFPDEEDDVAKDEIINDKGFSDQEWENDTDASSVEKLSNSKSRPVAAVLNALCAAYGSSNESSEDEADKGKITGKVVMVAPLEINNATTTATNLEINIEPSEVRNVEIENDNDSGPEEVAIQRTEIPQPDVTVNSSSHLINSTENKKSESNGGDKKSRKRKRDYKKLESGKENEKKRFTPQQRNFVPKKRLTLLQKLLEPDIRHERNVILQCLRYVVENNFFGVGQ